jgi:hypothetical protein
VGLDPDDVVLRYEEAIGPPTVPPPQRSGGLAVAIGVAVGAALIVAALVGWLLRAR